MEGTIYSLIPPILALAMVIITKRVVLSLGIGTVVGALMLADFQIGETAGYIYTAVRGLFVTSTDNGAWALNKWNLYIIFFIFFLGMMTSFLYMSGGSKAFGDWIQKVIKTRTGAQITSGLFGVAIFFDDYFNSLAVGNISRPITDRYKVSRAKLAYILDSTAAPMCVISPISSWGAYIIALIGGILTTYEVKAYSSLEAFIRMIPMNIYAIVALLMVFAVAWFKINLGPMRVHERRAVEKGQVLNPEHSNVPGEATGLPESEKGKLRDLVWPIVVLIAATVAGMVYTGIQTAAAAEMPITILTVFENTQVAKSLFFGSVIGLIVTVLFFLTKGLPPGSLQKGFKEGFKSMLPAVLILLFAWMIAGVIGDLGTGEYLAGLANENLSPAYLPALLFVLSGVMAFATGTSWGTFGIMLPIAGDIAAGTDIALLLPMLSAVLAGSVFGDHCSPISDTTILSSVGAGSHHIDHVVTQLPYALIGAGISIVGYLVLGITGSTIAGLLIALAVFAITVMMLKKIVSKDVPEKEIV